MTDRALIKRLLTGFRFWAALPSVRSLALSTRRGVTIVKRPKFPRGVCTGCGCSEFDPCIRYYKGAWPVGCRWINRTQTRCSSCGPAPAKH